MGYLAGTIWIVLAFLVVSFAWKLYKQRREIKSRIEYYVASGVAERALKGLTSSKKKL